MLEFATTCDLRNVKEAGAGPTLLTATSGQIICDSTPRNTVRNLAVCQVFRLGYGVRETEGGRRVGRSLQETIKLTTKSGFWAIHNVSLQVGLGIKYRITLLETAASSTSRSCQYTRMKNTFHICTLQNFSAQLPCCMTCLTIEHAI